MWATQIYCCCITARQGTVIIGLLFLAGTIGTTVWSGWDAANLLQGQLESQVSVAIKQHGDEQEVDKPWGRGVAVTQKTRSLDLVITYGAVILSAIDLGLTILLFIGVAKRNAASCKPFLYYNGCLTLLFGILMIYISFFLWWVYRGWLWLYLLLGSVIAMCVLGFLLNVVHDYCYELEYAEFFNSPEWKRRRYDDEAYGYGEGSEAEISDVQEVEDEKEKEADAIEV